MIGIERLLEQYKAALDVRDWQGAGRIALKASRTLEAQGNRTQAARLTGLAVQCYAHAAPSAGESIINGEY